MSEIAGIVTEDTENIGSAPLVLIHPLAHL